MGKFVVLAAFALCAFVSCKDDEVRTYKVATDEAPLAAEEAPHDNTAHSGEVTWQEGADWKQESGGQFLTAAYSLPSGARVTVSKLGGDGGGLAPNVNRWRGQIGLKPLTEDKVIGQPSKITDSEAEMLLFNLVPEDAPDKSEGILAAVVALENETWYFKFTGPASELRKSGGVFMDFLQTIRIGGSETNAPPPTAEPKFTVTAPEGWVKSKGSSMRVASYSIPAADGSAADVSVVPLPGESGSLLENVNRWRAQLQLPPLDSEDDPALGKMTRSPAGEFFLSHMASTEPVLEGKKAAISSAILKKPGMTWFFKVTGEASLVEANREKFAAFVSSASIR